MAGIQNLNLNELKQNHEIFQAKAHDVRVFANEYFEVLSQIREVWTGKTIDPVFNTWNANYQQAADYLRLFINDVNGAMRALIAQYEAMEQGKVVDASTHTKDLLEWKELTNKDRENTKFEADTVHKLYTELTRKAALLDGNLHGIVVNFSGSDSYWNRAADGLLSDSLKSLLININNRTGAEEAFDNFINGIVDLLGECATRVDTIEDLNIDDASSIINRGPRPDIMN